jgi:hypothetical protein
MKDLFIYIIGLFFGILVSTLLILYSNEIKKILSHVPSNFQNCLDVAYNEFHNLFIQSIIDLLKKFPADFVIYYRFNNPFVKVIINSPIIHKINGIIFTNIKSLGI